ncbi:MAG: MFS transporter [Gammaproteobacteria bacterium]|nr:MFS transporter [Gammaproteobacteria bacterium]
MKRVFIRLQQLVDIEAGEVRAMLLAFSYFFSLLCSYYILRPMRDEMGIAGGVENLQWLFTGTFLAMLAMVPLFGWLTSCYKRSTFLPVVYVFFIISLLLFYLLFNSDLTVVWVARAFFIWVSVFNLFVVSVFWSFMADIFTNRQAQRLFGFIAAGGTAGAIFGPALTTILVKPLGAENLLLLSAFFLGWAILCISQLNRWRRLQEDIADDYDKASEKPLGGSFLSGIRLVLQSPYLLGIALLMLLFTTLATFLYFQQAQIIGDSFTDPDQRTAVFAAMDFAVNLLTLLIQLFLTGRLVRWLGVPWTLAMVPMLLCLGFVALAFSPVLAVLVVVQVIRRAGNYAIMRPSREMLYVVLGREEKYKAKNFIDTAVYRGGDAVSAWVYTGLRSLGLGLSGIAWIAVPLAALWALLGYRLGQEQKRLAMMPQADRKGGN